MMDQYWFIVGKEQLRVLQILHKLTISCNFSDGGGRSGVFLAIDSNLELAEEEENFFLFGYLKKLKQSRRCLIENIVRKIIIEAK